MSLVILNNIGVVEDGYAVSTPFLQPLELSFGDNAFIQTQVLNSDGYVEDITGGALILTIKTTNNVPKVLVVSREAVLTDTTNGDGYFIIGTFDFDLLNNNPLLLQPNTIYSYDVVYIDSLGNQAHIIPVSDFTILDSDYLSGQDVSVPASQQPLAQGPAGAPGTNGDIQTNSHVLIDGQTAPVSLEGLHTLSLEPIDGVAGSYTLSNITVDAYGIITAASNGSSSAGVSSLTGGGGITVSSATGDVVLGSSGIPQSSITNLVSDLAAKVPSTRIVNSGNGLIGGGSLASDLTLSMPVVISPASFTNTNLTVDAYGRITAASNGSTGGVTSVSNSDGSLVISPTTGSVVGSIDTSHSNTWSSTQTFNDHIAVDGYTINISSGAHTNDVLAYNGSAFIPSAPAATGVTSIATTAPLLGGTITTTGTISIPQATGSVDGYLVHTDWTTFNNKGSGSVTSIATAARLTGGTITTTGTLDLATSGTAGSYSYTTFDAYGRETSGALNSILTTSPITGGGDLSATRTIAIPQATTSIDGYLSHTDWNTFNAKGSGTVTSVATGAGLSGGTITTTGTLTLNLANSNTFTKAQGVASVGLSDGTNIATDASLGNVFTVTLGGNRTLSNPTNLVSGFTYIWIITQDGSGSRTLAYGTTFTFAGGVKPILTTTAAAVDMIAGVYDGSKLRINPSLNYS